MHVLLLVLLYIVSTSEPEHFHITTAGIYINV